MDRRPIQARIRASPEDEQTGPGVPPDAFRDAMARWPSGVAVVAVRDPDDGRVYATTVTAFASVSLEPPLVLVSLGPGAVVLPYLQKGEPVGVSFLAGSQRRLATVYSESLAVGGPELTSGPAPLIPGAAVGLRCTVDSVVTSGDHHVVFARVDDAEAGPEDSALVFFWRKYRALEK